MITTIIAILIIIILIITILIILKIIIRIIIMYGVMQDLYHHQYVPRALTSRERLETGTSQTCEINWMAMPARRDGEHNVPTDWVAVKELHLNEHSMDIWYRIWVVENLNYVSSISYYGYMVASMVSGLW